LSRVAIRYSKALFQLAREENLVGEVQSDLKLIKEICTENADFQNMLINPLIEEYSKAKVLKDLFEKNINPLSFRFLQLLGRKKRSGFLLEMIDRFMDSVLEYKGILAGTLIASCALDSEQVEGIKKKVESITGKSVILSEQIDESMVGGFIVKIKDTVIDLSIRTQLEKLRTQLIQG
jgi:F-type H+-transporting ATPase subunit delta